MKVILDYDDFKIEVDKKGKYTVLEKDGIKKDVELIAKFKYDLNTSEDYSENDLLSGEIIIDSKRSITIDNFDYSGELVSDNEISYWFFREVKTVKRYIIKTQEVDIERIQDFSKLTEFDFEYEIIVESSDKIEEAEFEKVLVEHANSTYEGEAILLIQEESDYNLKVLDKALIILWNKTVEISIDVRVFDRSFNVCEENYRDNINEQAFETLSETKFEDLDLTFD